MSKRVVLIHAMAAAIHPTLDAFNERWGEATLSNLLDDGLPAALRREGGLTPAIVQRICALATYGAQTGADGILVTCSAFTPAMDAAKQLVAIPVLKPDEAMVSAALDAGRRIGVVATLPESAPVSAGQIRAAAAARGNDVEVVTAAAPDALKALNGGDTATHDRLVAEAASKLATRVDVICLAQFSMARARAAVERLVDVPVLTSPAAAVARLKTLLAGIPTS